MTNTVISIEDGVIKFLVNEATSPLIEGGLVQRASHVLPVHPILRGLFSTLRRVFGEKGLVASFTRLWPCEWQVDLSPIGRGMLPGTFKSRAAAIDAEILYLNETFI